jgi:hypothetical protein
MPTSTDLVTDLPADFETFGQAVDTSLADLKGGTTGQILAKASNTNMDFTWVAQDDSNAIQNAIVDAKGDLIAASAADTPARLAVGNNGEILVADSSTSTGLRYTAGTVQGNPVLNSAMQVWQRGTTFAINNANTYTADRWQGFRGVAGLTISRQDTNDTTNLPFIQYAARVARDSGNTSTSPNYFATSFENINSIPFAGKTITFSFYARAGANYSAASGALKATVATGTGTDQNWIGITGAVYPINDQTATLTTTWQRFTFTGNVGATAKQLFIYLVSTPVGTAGANDWYEITGLQIDVGSVALPFRTNGETLQGELAACQRYYYRSIATGSYSYLGRGIAANGTAGYYDCLVPVQMRVFPTSVDFSTLGVTLGPGTSIYAISAVSLNASTVTAINVSVTNSASGYAAGSTSTISTNGSTAGYIGFSAEL